MKDYNVLKIFKRGFSWGESYWVEVARSSKVNKSFSSKISQDESLRIERNGTSSLKDPVTSTQ